MKKIAIVAFLLAVCVAAGRAQESRQDISLSGMALVKPFIASSSDVQVHSTTPYGALLSYRFMLTPSNALEANYGITYQNNYRFEQNGTFDLKVLARTQEATGAFVHSFNFKKFNPFLEAGGGTFIFLPILNSGTKTLDSKQQMQMGAIYGAGLAYEVSPSFDIRTEFRGIITKVPTFGVAEFSTNRWYKTIAVPTIGLAYHF